MITLEDQGQAGRLATPAPTTEEHTATITAALDREAAGYDMRTRIATERLESATDPVMRAQLQAELERAQAMRAGVGAELNRLRPATGDSRRTRKA